MRLHALSVVLFLAFATTSSSRAAIMLNVSYTGDVQYAAAFTSAANVWGGLLSGWQDGRFVSVSAGSSYNVGDQITQIFINASVIPIDGPGGILGQAGPTAGGTDSSGFVLATDGIMQFDSADVAGLFNSGLWEPVILHEMAHVMGFGTLWTANGVYVNGSGEFTGANATAAWQSEFGQPGTPDVELGGGGGTANGHWNEVDGGGGLTGITDGMGRDMRDELMTGWLNPNPFISDMTVQSFVDIGFTANAAAVPEPTSMTLMAAGLATLIVRRRRRRSLQQAA